VPFTKSSSLSIILVVVSLCNSSSGVPYSVLSTTKVYTDAEAYRVYAVILRENRAYTEAASVIIRQKTVPYSPLPPGDCVKPSPEYSALVALALGDYERVNRSRWNLSRLFTVDKPYELAPETEFAGRFWRPSSALGRYMRNHQNFPGIVELSAVGFNPEKTIAVVSMNDNCGPMCSGGDMKVLRKEGGQWRQLIAEGLGCFWKS